MKMRKICIISAILSIVFLSGCNVEKRDALNQHDDVNFRPVRYERNQTLNENESNNDLKINDNLSNREHNYPEQIIKDKKKRLDTK